MEKAGTTINVTGDQNYTYSGLPQGPSTFDVSGSGGEVTFSYSGTGSTSYGPVSTKPSYAGTYSVTATVAEDENFAEATSLPYPFTINKANPAINIIPYSVMYNGSPNLATGTATGNSGEVLSGLDLSATEHTNAGNYTDFWAFIDVTGNYNDDFGTIDNIIDPKSLTFTASDQIKCFGNEFTFSGTEFSSMGLVVPETIGSVSFNCTGASAAAIAGNYEIVPFGATGGTFNPDNYNITYTEGQMTVNPLPALTSAEQSVKVCEGTVATINLSGLVPEKIFSLDYSIDGVAQTTKTGLYSDVSGNSGFTTPVLTANNDGQILKITGITITSETPNCSKSFSESVTLNVIPLPTLSGGSLESPVCEGTSGTVNLSGLLSSTTFTLYYLIDGVDQAPVSGLVANASGNSNFATPPLTSANDGQVLEIYGIEITSEFPGCYKSFTEDVILITVDEPTATISGEATICDNGSTTPLTVNLTGTAPGKLPPNATAAKVLRFRY